MKKYVATITVTAQISAPNEEKAQERAARLAILLTEYSSKIPKWLYGDMEIETAVEEQKSRRLLLTTSKGGHDGP